MTTHCFGTAKWIFEYWTPCYTTPRVFVAGAGCGGWYWIRNQSILVGKSRGTSVRLVTPSANTCALLSELIRLLGVNRTARDHIGCAHVNSAQVDALCSSPLLLITRKSLLKSLCMCRRFSHLFSHRVRCPGLKWLWLVAVGTRGGRWWWCSTI